MKARGIWPLSSTILGTSSSSYRATVCRDCADRIGLRYGGITRKLSRQQSSWTAAAEAARSAIPTEARADLLQGDGSMDPFQLVASEMQFLSKNIRRLIGSGHPSLDTVAKYYTQATGKRFRPLLVLLMSRATSRCPRTTPSRPLSFGEINEKMTHPDILLDTNPDQAKDHEQATTDEDPHILPAQRRLAEITELIHTASLLHDDVIDGADTRRSSPSANLAFGNKMSILAGDFMLGRASVALARLRNAEVIELLATVIANLVEGEVMQLKNSVMEEAHPTFSDDMLQYYLQKTYLKSASLISKSCRATTILGSCEPDVVDKAYAFGKNLGLCFQLVDDMLDYTVSAGELGKPAGADLHLGLATAPLLFAWKSDERLGELVGRRFSEPGDVDTARGMVLESQGLEQTRALAEEYAKKAEDAISEFPDSEAVEGLRGIVRATLQRRR